MDLLTRQQAQHHWFEADPRAKFDDLLEALGLYKDISTEYGLNQSVHQQWRCGDPHKKSGDPDRHDYEIKVVDGVEVTPGPVWHSLYRWIISQADEFFAFQTVYLITDNRDLLASTVSSTAGLSHWPMAAAWWKERIRYVGPYGERTTVVFVPISADTGLDKVHPTWAGTYILDACVFLFPDINFALIDSDCVPVTRFEIQELWLSCAEPDSTEDESRQPAAIPSSPIAPAQKRAKAVDMGQATQQQPGPPIKLPKSRSVENLMASAGRSPTPAQTGNFEDEVDFGDPSHRAHTQLRVKKRRAETPRQRLRRARDRLTSELPLKYQNRWSPKASSWSVKPLRKSMLDWSLCWHLDIAAQFQRLTLLTLIVTLTSLPLLQALPTVIMLKVTYRPLNRLVILKLLSPVDC